MSDDEGASRKQSKKKRKADDDGNDDQLLTHRNLVHVATEFARSHASLRQEDDLGVVLQELTTRTRWIASHALLKGGVSQYYFDLFRSRMTAAPAPVWWDKRPANDVIAVASETKQKKHKRQAEEEAT